MTLEYSENGHHDIRMDEKGHLIVTDGIHPEEALPDLVCFSHLRWDFVFQRPQHLLTRFGRRRRVFYVEEPVRMDIHEAFNKISTREEGVMVIVPHIPSRSTAEEAELTRKDLLDAAFSRWKIRDFVAWYYSPMFLSCTSHLKPLVTIYDCMDELTGFAGAPPRMAEMEQILLSRADMVFTGGFSLYEAKKNRHRNVFPFPSSIDKEHFIQARGHFLDPSDQRGIPVPRIGYHGVIDERLNLGLLAKVADLRPSWHWILIGPVCKIDPAILPVRPNIHYLGKKDYKDLPRYLGKWQAAMMPFAHNASTRYISPTKTPEYLAAGRPVVSTSIRDVENPYGRAGLVQIADTPEEFVKKCDFAMTQADDRKWRSDVWNFLAQISWDKTWSAMNDLVLTACNAKAGRERGSHV
jgi:hypothetical protein